MKIACFALVLTAAVLAVAEPQFYYPGPWNYNAFFRSSQQQPDLQQALVEGRLFFGTQTVTLGTSTITATSTITSTCTTSTAALTACVAAGRRRRSEKNRGLFYDEEDSIFLNAAPKVERAAAEESEEPKQGPVAHVPFVVQPGFEHLTGNRQARFMIAFTSATTTITVTTSTTASLVAICSSTSAFQLCGSTGK